VFRGINVVLLSYVFIIVPLQEKTPQMAGRDLTIDFQVDELSGLILLSILR